LSALTGHFAAMARNNRWANHVLLRACARLDTEAFTARRTSFFPSISATLSHIYFVDTLYVDALEEGGLGLAVFRDERVFSHASDLIPLQAKVDWRLIRFCDGLAEADLPRKVTTDRGEKGQLQERIDSILAHLFQHQIHHRGQVHAMLAGTEVKPPQLDEFFLDFERAGNIDEALAEGR
jgi:uncharacterized damage-inducible protein DinB